MNNARGMRYLLKTFRAIDSFEVLGSASFMATLLIPNCGLRIADLFRSRPAEKPTESRRNRAPTPYSIRNPQFAIRNQKIVSVIGTLGSFSAGADSTAGGSLPDFSSEE